MPSTQKRQESPVQSAEEKPQTTGATKKSTDQSSKEVQAGGEKASKQRPGLNISDLQEMSIQNLAKVAKDLSVEGTAGIRKQELIFQILKAQAEQ